MTPTANNMLSLFSSIDQPYRCQQDVCIEVGYSEYRHFVENLHRAPIQWLSFGKEMYQKALQGNGALLHQLFYYDLSRVAINELSHAVSRGKNGTYIVHAYDGVEEYMDFGGATDRLLGFSREAVQKGSDSLGKDMLTTFNICGMTQHNTLIYRYAWLLRTLSFTKNPAEFNICIK